MDSRRMRVEREAHIPPFYMGAARFGTAPMYCQGQEHQEIPISTHPLRVERDDATVTAKIKVNTISTHPLRVERDLQMGDLRYHRLRISTHPLRVERDAIRLMQSVLRPLFQPTRSVWSGTWADNMDAYT